LVPTATPTVEAPSLIARIFTEINNGAIGRVVTWIVPTPGAAGTYLVSYDIRVKLEDAPTSDFILVTVSANGPEIETNNGLASMYIEEDVFDLKPNQDYTLEIRATNNAGSQGIYGVGFFSTTFHENDNRRHHRGRARGMLSTDVNSTSINLVIESGQVAASATVANSVTAATLCGLHPTQCCEIQVFSCCTHGRPSSASEIETCCAAPASDAPTSAPTASPLPCPDSPELSCVMKQSETCIDIAWELPMYEDGGIGPPCHNVEVVCPTQAPTTQPTMSPSLAVPGTITRIFVDDTTVTWITPSAGGFEATIEFYDIRIKKIVAADYYFVQRRFSIDGPEIVGGKTVAPSFYVDPVDWNVVDGEIYAIQIRAVSAAGEANWGQGTFEITGENRDVQRKLSMDAKNVTLLQERYLSAVTSNTGTTHHVFDASVTAGSICGFTAGECCEFRITPCCPNGNFPATLPSTQSCCTAEATPTLTPTFDPAKVPTLAPMDALPVVEALVPVKIEFDSSGISGFNETSWKAVMAKAANGINPSDVEVVEVFLYQRVGLQGLTQDALTAKYETALMLAYESMFPAIHRSEIVFDSVVVSSSRRRLQSSGYNITLSVKLSVQTATVQSFASALVGGEFVGRVKAKFSDIGENYTTVVDQVVTGMDIVSSIEVVATQSFIETVLENVDFVSDLAAAAKSIGIIGASSSIEFDPSLVVFITMAPTAEPTASPVSASPTLVPSFQTCPEAPELECGDIRLETCVDILWNRPANLAEDPPCYEAVVACPTLVPTPVPTASPTFGAPEQISQILAEGLATTVSQPPDKLLNYFFTTPFSNLPRSDESSLGCRLMQDIQGPPWLIITCA
jgi:hypothetical protein